MRRIGHPLLGLVVAVVLLGCSAQGQRPMLYQTSTLDALMEGVYDGDVTLGELKRHGDIGLGTFAALDGEMVVLDGVVYQVRLDGKVYRPDDRQITPFAVAAFQQRGQPLHLTDGNGIAALERQLDALLAADRNIPVLVRIDGVFEYVKTRSVPRQNPPYARLADVAKKQATFEFRQVKGTIVALRCPAFMQGANLVGWHMHFLTADRAAGGHMLDCRLQQGDAVISRLDGVVVSLPRGPFRQYKPLSRPSSELDQIEKASLMSTGR